MSNAGTNVSDVFHFGAAGVHGKTHCYASIKVTKTRITAIQACPAYSGEACLVGLLEFLQRSAAVSK